MDHCLSVTAAALVGCLVAAQAAMATPEPTYQLSGDGVSQDADLTANITYAPLTGGGFTEDVWIGPLTLTVTNLLTSNSTVQTLYCANVFQDYNPGSVYTLGTLSDTQSDATKTAQITALLIHVTPNDVSSSAALQASIWEIQNEPELSGYDITNGVFSVTPDDTTGGTAAYQAFVDDTQTYLTDVTNGTWTSSPRWIAAQYEGIPGGGDPSQPFVFLSDPTIAAPEPASLLLIVTGLSGLWCLHRWNRRGAVAGPNVLP